MDERCRRCGATVDVDQEWCLECGAARTQLRPPPDWRFPLATVLAAIALLVAGLVAAVVILAIQA